MKIRPEQYQTSTRPRLSRSARSMLAIVSGATVPRRSPRRRPEQVIARIDEHLTALDRATCDLHAETTRAERDGCTRDEIDAIEEVYVRAPLEMLLITTKTVINAMPNGSGFDLDQIVQIIERHATGGTTNHEMAEDLVELLRECIAHIRKEVSGTDQEQPNVPRIH